MNSLRAEKLYQIPDENGEEKRTNGMIWKEAVNELLDPTSGMSEEEKAACEQKIIQKLKNGRKLTSQEMNYLRINNPSMYQIAKRVELAREALKERLKNCRSKEEVQDCLAGSLRGISKGDPAREYMAAMVQREATEFRKSSNYARLPQKKETEEKKKELVLRKSKEDTDKDSVSPTSVTMSPLIELIESMPAFDRTQ